MNNYAIYKTPFGFFMIKLQNNKVILLKKIDEENVDDYGNKNELTDLVYAQVLEYFEGKRKFFDFPYEFIGTPFQVKVWQALCDIPYGETRSYKDIAIAIGNEKASRAIGMANNRNPISIAVPCHRVIGTSGKLVGYAGGLNMKEKLLKMEYENK